MKNSNRDLLVLVRDGQTDHEAIQHELQQLNRLLLQFETVESFCTAHEVFDLNKYRVVTSIPRLQKIINKAELKPFIFICNKN
jgi:hypothetical protein